MEIRLPGKVNIIIETLEKAGYEAYAVGGCVRDSVLGKVPNDWDITTSARPEQVRRLFRRTVDTGIRHGTITVLLGNEGFEVTTYRIDGIYEDGRHPASVTFTASLEEDLKRRDFTINAMAYNQRTGVVDLFGGQEDLQKGVIRAVGDPEARFQEDALRMMRAVRFAAQLGFEIHDETSEAIRVHAPELSKVSAERIRAELEKLLVSDHPEKLRDTVELGLTKVFLPELDACMEVTQHNEHHIYTVGEHSLRAVEAVRKDRILRLTMLLHDLAKPECKMADAEGNERFPGHPEKSAYLAALILRRLKYDNETIRCVKTLVRYHGIRPEVTPAGVRHQIVMVGKDLFPLLFEVKVADGAAQRPGRKEEKQTQVDEWKKIYDQIIADGDCLSLKELAVSGSDLIAAGQKPGRGFGKVLQVMLEDVLEEPSHNSKDYLMGKYASVLTNK